LLKKSDFIVPEEGDAVGFDEDETPFCICMEVIRKKKLNTCFNVYCRYTGSIFSPFEPCFTHRCIEPEGNAYIADVYRAVMDVIEQRLDESGQTHLSGTVVLDLDTWGFKVYSRLMSMTISLFEGSL